MFNIAMRLTMAMPLSKMGVELAVRIRPSLYTVSFLVAPIMYCLNNLMVFFFLKKFLF